MSRIERVGWYVLDRGDTTWTCAGCGSVLHGSVAVAAPASTSPAVFHGDCFNVLYLWWGKRVRPPKRAAGERRVAPRGQAVRRSRAHQHRPRLVGGEHASTDQPAGVANALPGVLSKTDWLKAKGLRLTRSGKMEKKK